MYAVYAVNEPSHGLAIQRKPCRSVTKSRQFEVHSGSPFFSKRTIRRKVLLIPPWHAFTVERDPTNDKRPRHGRNGRYYSSCIVFAATLSHVAMTVPCVRFFWLVCEAPAGVHQSPFSVELLLVHVHEDISTERTIIFLRFCPTNRPLYATPVCKLLYDATA